MEEKLTKFKESVIRENRQIAKENKVMEKTINKMEMENKILYSLIIAEIKKNKNSNK